MSWEFVYEISKGLNHVNVNVVCEKGLFNLQLVLPLSISLVLHLKTKNLVDFKGKLRSRPTLANNSSHT